MLFATVRRWPRRTAFLLGLLAFLMACTAGTVRLSNANSAQPAMTVAVVSPEVIVVFLRQGTVTHARQEPYRSQPQDQLETSGNDTWVSRRGQVLGTLVGSEQSVLYGFDRYSEEPFDANRASQPRSYRIQSSGDSSYRQSVTPTEVHRKSKPVDTAQVSRGDRRWAMEHRFYLRLPKPLTPGQTYQIQLTGQDLPPLTLAYQPDREMSEAVHVSAVGFRPDDPVKVGFLSTWMGTGGGLSYPEGLSFQVIDEATGRSVFTGRASRRYRDGTAEDARDRTYTLTDVDQLDFSALTQPGQYRLCVDTVGCSTSFAVAEDAWQQAFSLAARGFYHQRSGIALKPPYTDIVRPRPFHPDDGITVYHSTTGLMDTGNGLDAQGTDEGNFANLVAGKTDAVVANAWGGYFDAGDWDRRIQHLDVARWLLELIELFPEPMENLALNIPESANDRPDLLDEALWGVDFFRRLQTSEGGVRGGIESAEHPKRGETSWQETLPIMAYAPDPWSSYVYAGVAARTARLMGTYAADQAQGYRDSALAAMAWAEARYQDGIEAQEWPRHRIEADRALAALELYHLTGDRPWHERFVEARSAIPAEARDDYRIAGPQREIAFLYSRLPADQVDGALQAELRATLLAEADAAVETGQTTAFGWTKVHPSTPVGWGDGLGAPKARTLLRAHALTGGDRYLDAALLACQFSAGANPDNMTYTTGLGHKSPQNPLVIDQRITGDVLPGLTLYGPIDNEFYGSEWFFDVLDSVAVPPARQWPSVETYFDIFYVPNINEFTVMQSMGDAAYAWGYLAGRSKQN
ncbi:glycoside hydrolase family 9 protein [Leptolyngbya sp. CCNP1308]|uniref:glycoside hydrolase family 9 protein n=1 Tax=Leptolyngbya sp. CCNP1308 TaxID=3110255 RepID=UPI002B2167CE|nr:glycoside hydrolase family 9 protein [Leptolyngbya sp. CCNP1308]MEA5450313.1 glycoside hydrolase family 9 protein [Leptolyngbya sp. CCNP1308]